MMVGYLVDGDLAAFMLFGLGNNDAEDTVPHRGRDGVLINAAREGELAVEFANRALVDVILGVRLLYLLHLSWLVLLHLCLRSR